jgi:carbonic anhydrase
VELEHLTGLLQKIKPAVNAARAEFSPENPPEQAVLVQRTAERNVHLTVEQIKKQSPLLDAMAKAGEIDIVGAMYDVETGHVEFYSELASAPACSHAHLHAATANAADVMPGGLPALGKSAL